MLSHLTSAVRRGISSMIVARGSAVRFHPKANGHPVDRRALHQVQVAAVEPKNNLSGCRPKGGTLRADGPRSAQTLLIQRVRSPGLLTHCHFSGREVIHAGFYSQLPALHGIADDG